MSKPRFHGSPERFRVVADFIANHYGRQVTYIADVAGGQGMLTRILNKKYNYKAEVIDPRTYNLAGVPARHEYYKPEMASYYDLIIGLHPDQALRPVVESAIHRPILVVPCCNFWDTTRKLGRDALLTEIETYLDENNINHKRVEFAFDSPYRIGIITTSQNTA